MLQKCLTTTWLFPGTLDSEKPASAYSEKCTRGGLSPACHDHKTYGSKDIAQVGNQTFQNQVLL